MLYLTTERLCLLLSVVSLSGIIVTGDLVVMAEPEQTATEGETAVLTCTVTSHPPAHRVLWYRLGEDGSENEVSRQNDTTDPDFGVYQIFSVAQSDAGTYRCTARYLFGKEEIDISLVVLSKCRVEGKIYIYIYIYICIHTYISNLCKCCCFISLKNLHGCSSNNKRYHALGLFFIAIV